MRVVWSQVIHKELIRHAVTESPNECCGLLAGHRVGDELFVTKVHPLVNELESPIAFRSEPRSLLNAIRTIDRDAEKLLAIYHSHPTTEPNPSHHDRADHGYPATAAVIIGQVDHEWTIRCWWPDDRWSELEWQTRSIAEEF